jgi:hypothetical protein
VVVVPGATHLFAEPGALERVAESAAAWFTRHLGGRGDRVDPVDGPFSPGAHHPRR